MAVALSGFGQQKSAIRFLKRADKTLKKLQSVSYDTDYLFKGPGDKDTLVFHGNLNYAANPRDFFFGYDVYCRVGDYYDAYFSLGKSYRIIHQNKKIYPKRFLDPKKINLKQGPFSSNQGDNIFDEYFRDKNFISDKLSDKSLIFNRIKTRICSDTIHIIIRSVSQNTNFLSDTVYNLKYDFYFDRKTKLPLIIIRTGTSDKGSYYSKISFSYHGINQDSIHENFIAFRLPDDYELVENKPKKNHTQITVIQKIPAHDFSLTDAAGNPVNLADLKGKVVLLDFWYSSCAPCIKASHYLEDFTSKYTDSNLVILGMNPINGANKILQHNKKWKVSYAGVVCSEEVKNKYDVSSYPSFILIDKQGMIVYRNSGFSESLMRTIEQQIQKAIRE